MHKWVMFILFSAACVVGLIGVVTLYDKAPEHQEAEPAPAIEWPTLDAAAAETIYKSSCMGCHGGNLEGGMFPALDKVGSKLTKEQIFTKISNGGGGMPGFKSQLKQEEIANLAVWLSEKK